MKIGDKVRSSFALWQDCDGTVSGIVKREDGDINHDWIHVIFPETDKHYGFHQSFYRINLRVVS